MKLSLYKITNDYLDTLNWLMDQDELDQQSINDTIEGLTGEVEVKATNVAAFYKNLQKEVAAMKEYEREMRDRRNSLERKAERIKNYLLYNLQKAGIDKIKGAEFSISVRKGIPSVIIDDIESIQDDYIAKIEKHPDKRKIKEALLKDETVSGAHLETKPSLIIK